MTNNAGIVAAGEYTLAFAYDYQGRRIQKLVCTNSGLAYVPEYTNRFLYDGWNLVAILNPNASIAAAMMWGTDLSGSAQGAGGVGGLLAENLAANGVHFVAYDGNGNVTALVSASSGTVTANYEYGPFGEVIRATGPMAKVNPFMFSTKFYDWESGLYYYGYRYYNPSTGRWPSRDPLTEPGFSLLRQQASRVVSNNRIPDANTSTTSCSSCRKSQGQSSTASGQSKCQGKGKCQDDLYVFVGNDPISKWDYLGLNQPGCDPGTQWVTGLPGSTECYLKCCAQHDHCFDINHCKAWSAWPLMLCPWSKCGHCGWQTVACMAGCAAGGSGPDVGLYYCPNGGPPNQGTYYNNWSDIPASCFENGTPISQPPSWP
jgi:RHS repeat-associated protein